MLGKPGGEGKVYAVTGNDRLAAKIWDPPNPNETDSAKRKSQERAAQERPAKIEIMLRNRPMVTTRGGNLFVKPPPPFAWPEDALYGPDGRIVGFLMPKIDMDSFREIFDYHHPQVRNKLETERNKKYKSQDLLGMARNLAETVDRVHRAGYVIGDINDKNVLANDRAQIVIIDCDSMQVENPATGETYLCTVGRPEYMPPRLKIDAERTVNDDHFGLAVLIFQLLMRGLHPYQISNPKAETTMDKIRLGIFPYKDPGNSRHISPVAHQFKENWSRMEPNLRRCFREAFAPDYKSMRPSAAEWVDELDRTINPRAAGNSLAMERRVQESDRQLAVAQRERDAARQQLDNERVARNQAGQALQEIQQQLEDERHGRAEAEKRLNAKEQLARKQASQPSNRPRIEKAAKITVISASYLVLPVITALLFALLY